MIRRAMDILGYVALAGMLAMCHAAMKPDTDAQRERMRAVDPRPDHLKR